MHRTKIELNFFYMHFRDAAKFLELSKNENSKLKSFFARHSILSSVFSSEALINRVYSCFYIGEADLARIEKLSIQDKWLLSSQLCQTKNHTLLKFHKDKEPFQSFNEIIKIRNWLVHPKPNEHVDAILNGTFSLKEKMDIPYITTIKGKNYWPQTKIPINPFEVDEFHSEYIMKNLEEMITILLNIFSGVFNRKWLLEFSFRIEGENGSSNMHIDWLWEGYTPE